MGDGGGTVAETGDDIAGESDRHVCGAAAALSTGAARVPRRRSAHSTPAPPPPSSHVVTSPSVNTAHPQNEVSNPRPPTAPGVILVLGSPNDAHGNLHSVGVERCRRALRLHRDNPAWPLLLTGGFGEHFNTTVQPHAAYLRRWLEAHGVPPAVFLPFAESRNTLEDASLAKPLALATGARLAVVVTSDYHADRARFVFEREFAGTGVALFFVTTETDEAACQLDLPALKRHEVAALARLRAQ